MRDRAPPGKEGIKKHTHQVVSTSKQRSRAALSPPSFSLSAEVKGSSGGCASAATLILIRNKMSAASGQVFAGLPQGAGASL